MRIGVLKTRGLALLVAGLACLSLVSGQETKVSASESLTSLRARAEKGDIDAQFNLGVMYYQGRGVTQDYVEAARWFRKAAEQENAGAQFNLGVMYAKGQGLLVQDHVEAARWYRRAADQGHANGQFNLGIMYCQGQGVPQDYAEAHMWLNLAASRARANDQKYYAERRDSVAKMMTAQQIAEAQRRAREWKPKTGEDKGGGPMK